MNAENQENRGPRGPLIFTVPAYGLIVAQSLDWCFTSQKRNVSRSSKRIAPCLQCDPGN